MRSMLTTQWPKDERKSSSVVHYDAFNCHIAVAVDLPEVAICRLTHSSDADYRHRDIYDMYLDTCSSPHAVLALHVTRLNLLWSWISTRISCKHPTSVSKRLMARDQRLLDGSHRLICERAMQCFVPFPNLKTWFNTSRSRSFHFSGNGTITAIPCDCRQSISASASGS